MLTLDHPGALAAIADLNYGLLPFRERATGRYLLAVKLNKEALLAARMNRGFRLYLVPAGLRLTLGAICAFFDDQDKPQTVRIPLGDGDVLAADLVAMFSQDTFPIHLFDEHDRELMGYVARLDGRERFAGRMAGAILPRLQGDDWITTDRAMTRWFGSRTTADDAAAFDVVFGDCLFDDDRFIIEAHKPNLHGTSQPAFTSLVRQEPGGYQERDIGHMLWRVFPVESVIANPVRTDSGRELCDILVLTDEAVLVVQAKDSPNTEASIRRTIARKLATTLSHLDKAAGQLRGALMHVGGRDFLELTLSDGPVSISVRDRALFGLIVLNEMFDDHFADYSAPVLAIAQETGFPTLVLDAPTLHIITNRVPGPTEFFSMVGRTCSFALEHGEFPRIQFTGQPGSWPQDNDDEEDS